MPTKTLKAREKTKNCNQCEELVALLGKAAEEALNQIEVQSYVAEAKKRGRTNILKIGLAFCGKEFIIKTA